MALPLGEIYVFGAGKVGTALSRQLRRAGLTTTLRSARRGWPRSRLAADIVIIATRDDQIADAARQLAAQGIVGHRRKTVAVAHCAGSLGPSALAAVRGPRVAVCQMHPLLSFAARRQPPRWEGGMLLVQGDAPAKRLVLQLGRRLRLRPVEVEAADLALYHAAAALVANGSAALAARGAEMLRRAGLEGAEVEAALGTLLRSVADNVVELGFPAALTGPVRRGDHATVAAHLQVLRRSHPEALPLYLAVASAQLGLASAIGEASAADAKRLRQLVAGAGSARRPRDK